MPIIQAQVAHPWTSGLPRDVTINTFHFDVDSLDIGAGTDMEAVGNALQDFWQGDSVNPGESVESTLGALVSRVAGKVTVKFREADAAPGTPPFFEMAWTCEAGTQGGGPLPPEVALCLSYQGPNPGGAPVARTRGRIYLGPFDSGVVSADGRPNLTSNGSVGKILADAGERLMEAVEWVVLSRVPQGPGLAGIATRIGSCWVDNEFDTQRRRGRAATARTERIAG